MTCRCSTKKGETAPEVTLVETTEVLTNSSALSAIGAMINVRDAVWVRA